MGVAHTGDVLDLIDQRRSDDVVALVDEVADSDGHDDALSLLVAIQTEVGARWQSGTWSVAQEHAATAVVDRALSSLELRAEHTESQTRGGVVLTCAEGEWHVLPLRLVAHALGLDGWRVSFLGASMPAVDLEDYLRRSRPLSLMVSCSMTVNLPGAAETVAAAHRAEVPVLAGGAAFGPDERRARAVDADGWAPSPAEASDVLARWTVTPPRPGVASVDTIRHRQLVEARDRVLEAVLAELPDRYPPAGAASPSEMQRTREGLTTLVRQVEAAALVADSSIVDDHLDWLGARLEARGEPRRLAGLWLHLVREHLPSPG